jgi:hypothetical protein
MEDDSGMQVYRENRIVLGSAAVCTLGLNKDRSRSAGKQKTRSSRWKGTHRTLRLHYTVTAMHGAGMCWNKGGHNIVVVGRLYQETRTTPTNWRRLIYYCGQRIACINSVAEFLEQCLSWECCQETTVHCRVNNRSSFVPNQNPVQNIIIYPVSAEECRRSKWPRCLRRRSWSFGRRDRGFESCLRHGCLSSSIHRSLLTLLSTWYSLKVRKIKWHLFIFNRLSYLRGSQNCIACATTPP